MQRRHGVNRFYPPFFTQAAEHIEIRPLCCVRDSNQFKLIEPGESAKSRIGQGICRNHIAGTQQTAERDRQPMLSAVNDSDLPGAGRHTLSVKMLGHYFPFAHASGVRLIA